MSLQAQVIGLSLAYAALGVLALVGVARTRWPWPLKSAVIVLASLAYVGVFFGTKGLLGWSTPDPLPARFQVLWARTVDPDPASGNPGAVHLWLETLGDDNLPAGEPRAYRLPFSRRLAQKVEAVRVELQANHPQGGRTEEAEGAPDQAAQTNGPPAPLNRDIDPGGDPAGGGSLDPAMLGGNSKSVEFAPLPRPVLPAKEAP